MSAPLTSEQEQLLITYAFEGKLSIAIKGSYSPYSKFRVGAALLTPDGKIIRGANIENASYGGTICAERTALVKAASEGIREFVGLAVVSDVPTPISPCGICRQFIREFCRLDCPVLLVSAAHPLNPNPCKEPAQGELVTRITLGELLPLSFGPEHLAMPREGQ